MKIFSSKMSEAIVLGVLSGMRANAGLLCTGLLVRRHPVRYYSSSKLVKFFGNGKAVSALAASAAVELVMDKLPTTPDRIAGGGLTARIAAGAVCGATICGTTNKKKLHGAIAGGVAALVSTYCFYYLRKKAVKNTGIPDPVIGGAEDLLAVAGAAALLQ